MEEIYYKKYIPGVLPSPIDERDYTPQKLGLNLNILCAEAPLPDDFSLEYPSKVKNQFLVGSCLAHAISYCDEMEYYKKNKVFVPYSVGFPYANRNATDNQLKGLVFRQAVDHEVKEGNCYNSDFDYNIEYPDILAVFNPIKDELYKKAAVNKDKSYLSLRTDTFDEIRAFIYKYKKPVKIAISLYDSFYNTGSDGIVPLKSGNYKGGHGVACIGWKKDTSAPLGYRLKFINSYGENWGLNGYGYIADTVNECYGMLENDDIPVIPAKVTGWRVQIESDRLASSADNTIKELYTKSLAQFGKVIVACRMFDTTDSQYKVQCGYFESITNRDNMVKGLEKLGYKTYIKTIQK